MKQKKYVFIMVVMCILLFMLNDKDSNANDENILFGDCGEHAQFQIVKNTNGKYDLKIIGYGDIYDYGLGKVEQTSNDNKYISLAKAPWKDYDLENVYISDQITRIGSYNFCASKATYYKLPSDLEEIGYMAFYEGVHQKQLILPDKLKVIDAYAFYCVGSRFLEKFGVDTGYVNRIVFPKSLNKIGECAFYDCGKLEQIDLNGDTELETHCFCQCGDLEIVNMIGNVTRGENTEEEFSYCTSLRKVYLSDTYYWEEPEEMIEGSFNHDKSLKELIVSEKNRYYRTVDGVLYTRDMKKLISFLPGLKISQYYVPDGVEEIGVSAFKESNGLEYIYLPDSVNKLGGCAFRANDIKYVVLSNQIVSLPALLFLDNENLSVYVPKSVVQTVFNKGWSYTDTFGLEDGDRKIRIYGEEGSYIQEKYTSVFNKSIHCEFMDDNQQIYDKVVFQNYKIGRLPALSKDGYDFFGWSLDSSGVLMIDEDTMVTDNRNIKLYAQWKKLDSEPTLTASPTTTPTVNPTTRPTITPIEKPTATPMITPTISPTITPIEKPTVTPTVSPTSSPAITPTAKSTATPTGSPTVKPTAVPTVSPDDNEEEDDDIEDPVIYAKKSVTKHIGDKDFDIDNGIDSDGEVSYESSNNKVATVDRNGSVRIKGCGIAIITIFVDETENFYMDTKDVKVTVLPSNIKKFKVKSMENGIKCTWKKMNFNNVKCIIQASENRKFKKPVTAKPYSELKKGYWKGVGLKRNKVYYIRIRQIAKFSNKQFKYGKWSKVVKVKIK